MGVRILRMHVVSPSKGYILCDARKGLAALQGGSLMDPLRLFRFANMPIYMSIQLLS